MITLEVLRGDQVTPSVTWQAVSFMRCTWPGLFDGGLRWIDRPFPVDEGAVHVVARHGEVVVSHAAVVPLSIEQDGEVLSVSGLACVFTFAPYRGQGWAGRVLELVNEVSDAEGTDVAGLFCDPSLEGFYARHGWVTCSGGTSVGEDGHVSTDLRMMRFLSPRGAAAEPSLRDRPLHVAWAW